MEPWKEEQEREGLGKMVASLEIDERSKDVGSGRGNPVQKGDLVGEEVQVCGGDG